MAQVDSKLVDELEKATGKTREECEGVLQDCNGNYEQALRQLTSEGGLYAPVIDPNTKAWG